MYNTDFPFQYKLKNQNIKNRKAGREKEWENACEKKDNLSYFLFISTFLDVLILCSSHGIAVVVAAMVVVVVVNMALPVVGVQNFPIPYFPNIPYIQHHIFQGVVSMVVGDILFHSLGLDNPLVVVKYNNHHIPYDLEMQRAVEVYDGVGMLVLLEAA